MNKAYKLISSVAVVACDVVLLVRYAGRPDGEQGWFLPHTLVEYLEHPQDAALRAVTNQIELTAPIVADDLILKEIESFEGRDGSWHLPFHFRLDVASTQEPRTPEQFTAYQWFPLDALPSRDDVAHHGWAIDVIESVVGA
jgi:ADP-ribose pyrophosphatase YjhB (NUDIX family)